MKLFAIIPLLVFSFICSAQNTESRNIKVGVQIGRSQAYVNEANNIGGNTGTNTPLFHTMLNRFGITSSMGSAKFTKLHYKLDFLYQTLETASEVGKNKVSAGYIMPTLCLKPGVGFSIPIDERWKIIPSINLGLNANLDQDLSPQEWGISYTSTVFFATLNPGIELQINTDGAWYLSAYAEYQQGFTPVITSYYQAAPESENKMGVYNGSAMNFGIKLQYCLPCSN